MRARRFAKSVLHALLCAALAVGIVAAVIQGVGTLVVRAGFRTGCGGGPNVNDTDRVRQIVGLVHAPSFSYPMKDGAFDPYAFVRRGDIPRERYDIFRSKRTGTGPTDEEIAHGDYTNFPWERRRGELDRDPDARAVLLLWEKVPDKHGGRVVAFSDGSATYLEAEQFEALRQER